MANTTITLEQFHDLLANAEVVCMNDILYHVGYDNNKNPYVCHTDGSNFTDLRTVDGEIEVYPYHVCFSVQGNSIQMSFLHLTPPLLNNKN